MNLQINHRQQALLASLVSEHLEYLQDAQAIAPLGQQAIKDMEDCKILIHRIRTGEMKRQTLVTQEKAASNQKAKADRAPQIDFIRADGTVQGKNLLPMDKSWMALLERNILGFSLEDLDSTR